MRKKTTSTRKASEDVLTIGDIDALLLQVAPRLAESNIEDLVFERFWGAREARRAGTQWLAFAGSGLTHYMGLSTWIALSRSVPETVVGFVQDGLEKAGMKVLREMGRPLRYRMLPFGRLSDDGLELLVPATLVGPDKQRVVPRGSVLPTARGYVLRA